MFKTISQRVAYSYIRSLALFTPYLPGNLTPAQQSELAESQASLQAFFQAFYASLYEAPETFGLPSSADAAITGSEPNPKDFKQEVTRRMKPPRERIEQGIGFLRQAGETGELRGAALKVPLEAAAAMLKARRSLKLFLKGLEQAGLNASINDDNAILSNERFPAMMPALQEDFFHRSTPCGDCGWCDQRKNLGPSIFEFDGMQKKICWFTIGDMGAMDDEKVEIIQQYALMHEQLA